MDENQNEKDTVLPSENEQSQVSEPSFEKTKQETRYPISMDEEDGDDEEHESVAARRMRLLGIENDSKIHDSTAEITKGNFFKNLWYKRKWMIILSVFFLLVIGGLIFTCAIKEKTDISIAYNGPRELSSSQLETLNKAFSEVVPDYDKDGKTDIKWTNNLYRSFDQQVEYNGGVVPSVQQQTANNEALEQINYLVISGQFNFMLLDKAVFEEMSTGFYKISDLVEGDYSSITYEGRAVYFHATAFAKSHPELASILPKDTLICICERDMKMNKNLDKEIALLKAILEYNPNEE